jgi:hypothetical protein
MGPVVLPEWKEYENLVFETLAQENPDLVLERDVRIRGHLSGQKRQIDILARGNLAGHGVLVVFDCKHHSNPVDVNVVGQFSSLLDDVSADIGVLVTENGYTEAAEKLAGRSRVKLEIRTLDELRSYQITLDLCEECDPGEEHFPGVIEWAHPNSIDLSEQDLAAVGWCDWCNTIHMKCSICGSITGIPDVLYRDWVECLGGCETKFRVRYGEPGSREEVEVVLGSGG